MLNHAAMRRPDNSVSDMGMRLFEHKEPLNPPVNEHYPYYMIDHIVQYIYIDPNFRHNHVCLTQMFKGQLVKDCSGQVNPGKTGRYC